MDLATRHLTAAIAVHLALAAPLNAEEARVLPCRPTIACTAQIEATRVAVLEVGYLMRRLNGEVTQQSLPFLLKLSFNEWLQGQLGTNGPTVANGESHARFFDNAIGGAKARIFRSELTAISTSAAVSAPLPRQRGYVRSWDLLLVGYLSQGLPLGVVADFNVGLNLFRLDGAPIAQPWTALALNHDLPAGFAAMAEAYRFGGAAPVAPRDAGLLFAVSYNLTSCFVLDGGVDIGLLSDRTLSLFAGLSVSPGRL
jgi:hypothetical protein